MKSRNWLSCHRRMFEYYGGVPHVTATDCLKAGVVKGHLYDPDPNEDYSTAIVPARVRWPRDKAIVEGLVKVPVSLLSLPLSSRPIYFYRPDPSRAAGLRRAHQRPHAPHTIATKKNCESSSQNTMSRSSSISNAWRSIRVAARKWDSGSRSSRTSRRTPGCSTRRRRRNC